MTSFPVDRIIPQIRSALAEAQTVIIQAPPGSGKSTRIPPSLLDSPWLGGNGIVMLEPRRLAAVNLACWIARQIGESAGETVGYAVRFDRKISTRTRLEIVTEGLLTRRLQTDPYLDGIGAVIFDEFHERSIHTDTALALCVELQQTVRPELRIVIMSATLDREKMADLLPAARVLSVEGGLFPVEVSYLGESSDPVSGVVRGVSRALAEQEGDILVFLPGAAEIKRSAARLEELHAAAGLVIVPLYGDLPFAEQERAIMPGGRRKVVLATNIAETSLTIEGVTAVVDSGLVRRARFDRQRGLNSLVTESISRASAEQRAGRAGRLAPGRCYRLWSEHRQQTLLPFDPPEIMTADLAELALNLALWGVGDPSGLVWVDPLPPAALAAAGRMLQLLGALDQAGAITGFGRRMAGLPLPPRLSGLFCRAIDSGYGALGADLAAIMAERDFCRQQREPAAATADLLDRLAILARWRQAPELVTGDRTLDLAALRNVERTASQLRRLAGIKGASPVPDESVVVRLVATAFPDRIGRQREPGSLRYLLANGSGGQLDPRIGVGSAPYIVATDLGGVAGGEARIYSALSLAEADLREMFAAAINRQRSAYWNNTLRKVLAREEEQFGALILTSRPVKATADEVLRALLNHRQENGGSDLLQATPAAGQLQARLALLRRLYPEEGWPAAADADLLATLADWLPGHLAALARPEQLSAIDPAAVLRGMLSWQQTSRLEELAPTHLTVPSGSRISLDYAVEDGPVMAVKLQELFGLADTPLIANGRCSVLLHLLSPAGRPIQVTRDLRSFWDKTYPDVCKELKGRYPKHPWPDDPWSARPTRHTKKRSG